jgi:hypothetical protein
MDLARAIEQYKGSEDDLGEIRQAIELTDKAVRDSS